MKSLKATLNARVAALAKNEYFEGMPDSFLRKIAAETILRQFRRGETLFLEGEPCAGLHILDSGSVKLYRDSPKGRQYIVRVLQRGDTCNEVPVFGGGTNPVSAEALEETRVWSINADILRALAGKNPEFAQKVMTILSGNLRHFVDRLSEMAFYTVTHRLARMIHELPRAALDGSQGLRLTQTEMASYLGTVREIVARSLRELERSGAIDVENRSIRILDEEILLKRGGME